MGGGNLPVWHSQMCVKKKAVVFSQKNLECVKERVKRKERGAKGAVKGGTFPDRRGEGGIANAVVNAVTNRPPRALECVCVFTICYSGGIQPEKVKAFFNHQL